MKTIDLHARSRHKCWCHCLVVALLLSLGWQCASRRQVTTIRYVTVDPATRLEVVDWGGSGVSLVFLAGLGHTAHVFDDFAGELTDSFHVLGITRRGFGASSQPDTGYTVPTLVADIRIVLDSLGIDQAILIGHSLGGDEMTLFAHRYPETVKGLVYVEAAYNRVTAWASMAGYNVPESPSPLPSAGDSASAEAYRAYYARVNGVTMPLSEIKAMYQWTPDGRYNGSKTPGRIYSQIRASIRDPDYSGIQIPALAIYATDYPVTELFTDYQACDSTTQHAMRIYHAAALRTDKLSRDYFRTQMAKGRIVQISGAGHSLYITHAKETIVAIRAFLEEVL